MDSKQVIARFEAERQALSLMDHPNIAKVLDAGTTGSGRPFFVMELVKGQPITRYCDVMRLTLRERLELFLPVCLAIQHAHQKGLIHRDVKPSNVLVAEYDGRPVVKVIDFGIAKAISQPLTEKTMFTDFGQVVGTLEYMSPEQARVNQFDIDTRELLSELDEQVVHPGLAAGQIIELPAHVLVGQCEEPAHGLRARRGIHRGIPAVCWRRRCSSCCLAGVGQPFQLGFDGGVELALADIAGYHRVFAAPMTGEAAFGPPGGRLPLAEPDRDRRAGGVAHHLVGCGLLYDAQVVDESLGQGLPVSQEQFHVQGFGLPDAGPLVAADASSFLLPDDGELRGRERTQSDSILELHAELHLLRRIHRQEQFPGPNIGLVFLLYAVCLYCFFRQLLVGAWFPEEENDLSDARFWIFPMSFDLDGVTRLNCLNLLRDNPHCLRRAAIKHNRGRDCLPLEILKPCSCSVNKLKRSVCIVQ
jgi:hypothetical protein